MRVVLGTFACAGIEALPGGDLAAGVKTALRHYARSRESSARSAPVFTRCAGGSALGGAGVDVEVDVDAETQAVLEREARETSGVSVGQIATHAVLVYLADRDRASGPETGSLTWV
jgi:hypothetical protein